MADVDQFALTVAAEQSQAWQNSEPEY